MMFTIARLCNIENSFMAKSGYQFISNSKALALLCIFKCSRTLLCRRLVLDVFYTLEGHAFDFL